MSIDCFLDRTYHKRTYNCAHFVVEVWAQLFSEDISDKLQGFLEGPETRKAKMQLRRMWKQCGQSEHHALALMQRKGNTPHVGLLLEGKILHIHELGVEYQPVDVASRGFDRVRYYL